MDVDYGYKFDFDYRRDCIKEKFSSIVFPNLVEILSDISHDEAAFIILMSKDFDITEITSKLIDIKKVDDITKIAVEVLNSRGAHIEY